MAIHSSLPVEIGLSPLTTRTPMSAHPPHPALAPSETLLADCESRRQRRSGPGGQHRNKVETAVVLTHRPSGVQGEASERRSQEENRKQALFRLRVNLALEVRTPPAGDLTEDDALPPEVWRARVRGGRLAISGLHEDFPAILATALDFLAAADWQPKPAADRLGVTASQLIKLLKVEGRALALANHRRAERSLHLLK